ncbi:MAG: potassium channel family protein [Pseudanabaenaceae cyanobacterium]
MRLSPFNLFRTLRPTSKQFAVIGLGRFGRSVCKTLSRYGFEVLGIDQKEELVNQAVVEKIASHSIQLDSTQPHALEEAGVFEFDTVIVAIGNYIEESIITTLNLKEGQVKYVAAKASSEVHGTLLKKVGADLVVYPEAEMGRLLARRLTQRGVIEHIELDPEHSILEVFVPEEFHDKTLEELNLRRHYGVSVLAVSQDDRFQINPNPRHRLQKGSLIVVIGKNSDIARLPLE